MLFQSRLVNTPHSRNKSCFLSYIIFDKDNLLYTPILIQVTGNVFLRNAAHQVYLEGGGQTAHLLNLREFCSIPFRCTGTHVALGLFPVNIVAL